MKRNYGDLTGRKFGRFTVVNFSRKDDKGASFWLCRCECGKEKEVFGWSLISGHSTSCGCYRIELLVERNKQNPPNKLSKGESSKNRVLRAYKNGAKKRALSWELTDEQAISLFLRNCAYCNIEPRNISVCKTGSFIYNGIDRKDNTAGYTVENCVSCCKMCNYMKSSTNYLLWIEWLNRIRDNFKG